MRASRQERQKQDSRDKVLAAARDVLKDMPYALIAVEDIATRAGISRATFYRHFGSKFDVLNALLDEFWPRCLARYEAMSWRSDRSEEALMLWIKSIVELYQAERTLVRAFQQMMVIEPDCEPVSGRMNAEITKSVARSNASLAFLLEDSISSRQANVQIRLFLAQMDYFFCSVAAYDWGPQLEDGIRVLARNFNHVVIDLETTARRLVVSETRT